MLPGNNLKGVKSAEPAKNRRLLRARFMQSKSKLGRMKSLAKVSIVSLALTLSTPAFAEQAPKSMPSEYSEIMDIVNRLAAANDLGSQELAFTVIVGGYGAWKAEELGLCKEDKCGFFSSLNPFIQHKKEINEIIRQAYLYGDVNAFAHSNGTIEIPRVNFRLYGGQRDSMACTIAHEISHARDAHLFAHAEALSIHSSGMDEEQKKKLSNAISREIELLADQKAWEMTTRAGYPADLCERDLMFIHRSTGDGSITEPDSTHPGVQERIEKLKTYAAEHQSSLEAEPPTKGSWLYDSDLNVLRFIPVLQPGKK